METKRVLLSVLERHSGVVFLFAPTSPENLHGRAGRCSHCIFLCWFADFFVTRATLSVYLKAHSPANAAVVLSRRNGLESICCPRMALFTEGERNTREVSEGLGAQLWTDTCEVLEALRAQSECVSRQTSFETE